MTAGRLCYKTFLAINANVNDNFKTHVFRTMGCITRSLVFTHCTHNDVKAWTWLDC
jgi:hypothetical protein